MARAAGGVRRRRVLGRVDGAPGAQAAARRHRRRQDRCRCRLQDRPADPQPRRLRPHRRAVRYPQGQLRLGHPGVQHDDEHGPADPERPAVVRPVRARGHRRAHPRQDRRLAGQGHVDGRHAAARLRPTDRRRNPRARRQRCGSRHGPADVHDLSRARLGPRAAALACRTRHRLEGAGHAWRSRHRRPAVQPRRAVPPAAQPDLPRDGRSQGQGAPGHPSRDRRCRAVRRRAGRSRRQRPAPRGTAEPRRDRAADRARVRCRWRADEPDVQPRRAWAGLSLLCLGSAPAGCSSEPD